MTGAPYREGPTLEELARAKAERAEREREERRALARARAQRAEREREERRVELITRFAEAARASGVTAVDLARALDVLFGDSGR
jgi:hypothetical protein